MSEDFFKEETFEWLNLKNRKFITREVAEQLSGVIYDLKIRNGGTFEILRDEMLMELNAHVLGKQLPSFEITEHKFYKVPENPWQMFKDMYADKWFMRKLVQKWPVKFVNNKATLKAEWQQWAVYPWLENVPVSPQWKPVRVIFPVRTKLTSEENNGNNSKP